jgi:hypothetical protein
MTIKDEQRKIVIIGMEAFVIRTRYLAMLYIHGLPRTDGITTFLTGGDNIIGCCTYIHTASYLARHPKYEAEQAK